MRNNDPGQPLPDDEEPTVISQPISMPNQLGGVIAGTPSDPDPAQTAAARYAAMNQQAQFQLAANPPTIPPPLAVAAPAPIPQASPVALPPPAVAPVADVPAAPPSAGAPVGGGGGGSVPGQMDAAAGEVKAAGQESTQVGRDAVKVAEDKAKTDAEADRLRAAEAQASASRLSSLQATQKRAYDDSQAAFQQARADVANYKFTDFWANKTFAQDVLAGVGMLLGGASYDAHHENQAVNLIQSGIKRDADQQLQFLHSKEHLAELAQQGVRDTQSYIANELANFHTAESFKKEAVAAQIDQLSSTVRGQQNIVAARQVASGLREQAAKDQQSAIIQGTHNRVLQSEIALNRAKAANEGVGRQAKVQTAQEQAADKIVRQRLNDNKTVTTLLKEKEELAKADSLSVPDPKTGRVNGTAFQGAVDGFTKAITGLGARKGSIDLTTGAFGGVIDKVRRNIQKGIDGQYPAHDVEVFRQGVEKALRGNQLSLQTSRKLDEQAFSRHPLTKNQKDVYQTALDQRYGSGQDATPAAPQLRPDQVERLKAIPKTDPDYARAQQLLAGS